MKYADVSHLNKNKKYSDLKSGQLFKFTDSSFIDYQDLCLRIDGGYVNLAKNIFGELGVSATLSVVFMESNTLEVWEKW